MNFSSTDIWISLIVFVLIYIALGAAVSTVATLGTASALKPFGARVMSQPMTPEVVLQALGKV